MRVSGRHGAAAAAATLAVTGAVLVPATPAFAVARTCSIAYSYYGCSTSSIPANSTEHAILITAFAPSTYSVSVTCRAHDSSNGNQVGSVTSTHYISNQKRIGGLYGSYFLSCTRSATHSGGGGRIEN